MIQLVWDCALLIVQFERLFVVQVHGGGLFEDERRHFIVLLIILQVSRVLRRRDLIRVRNQEVDLIRIIFSRLYFIWIRCGLSILEYFDLRVQINLLSFLFLALRVVSVVLLDNDGASRLRLPMASLVLQIDLYEIRVIFSVAIVASPQAVEISGRLSSSVLLRCDVFAHCYVVEVEHLTLRIVLYIL